MPKLNRIDCSIELGPGNTKIPEYGARYSDGHVETFIVVPDSKIPFSVHLKSDSYIAPGLAFFVFIDGEYQCNRNRIGLKIPGPGVQPSEYEVAFRVRHKEEKTGSGIFVVRDWSFAKLDRETADKAPNVNLRFTSNVGTIEVIVLRCRTDQDDMPPLKVPRNVTEIAKKKAESGVQHSPKRSIAKKEATPPASENGGLFGMAGLFDGSCDTVNLDGPADERPVGRDGRVGIIPPPSMAWDSSIGDWVPESCLPPARGGRGLLAVFDNLTRPSRFRELQDTANDNEEAWFDGMDEHCRPPGVVVNQWGSRRPGDPHHDKYIGHRDRTNYNQYMREGREYVGRFDEPVNPGHKQQREYRGYFPAYEVPEYPTYVRRLHAQQPDEARYQPQMQNPIYGTHGQFSKVPHEEVNVQPAFQEDHQPKPQLIANELQCVRESAEEYIQQHLMSDSANGAKRDLETATRLQDLHHRGQGTLVCFPPWLVEVLRDIEVRRQYILAVQKAHSYADSPGLLKMAAIELKQSLLDLRLHKNYRIDVHDDALALMQVYSERVEKLKNFLEFTERYPRVTADAVRARLEVVRKEQDMAQRAWEEFKQDEHAIGGPHTTQHVVQQGGDGTFNNPPVTNHNDWANAPPNDDNVLGWRKVGSDTYKPRHDQGDREKADASKAGWSWKGPDQDDRRKSNDWKDGGDLKHSGSRKTREHVFSDTKSNSDRQKDQWHKSQSSRKSQSNRGWDNDNSNQQQVEDRGWGDNQQQTDQQAWNSSGEAKDANQNGWGGEFQQKSAAPSVRSATKAQSERPQAKIKPYWKEWNMPVISESAANADANAKQTRNEPRPVFNYKPLPLPAVPAENAKDASHGVQIGKGADYSHKCRRPIYMDTMDQPYAVFSFKYRSKKALEKILKIKIDDMDLKEIEEQIEKDRLNMLPKHKLVEELMERRVPSKSSAKKAAAGGDDTGGGENVKDNNGWGSGGDNDAGWGAQSTRSKSNHRNGSKGGGDWDQQSQNGGGGGWDDRQSTHSEKDKKSAKNGWNNAPAGDFGW